MKELVSVEEARRLVLAAAAPGPEERVLLAESLGRTLAAPIRSRDDLPPFDNASMDGYAVRTADLGTLPVLLRVIEDIPAGTFPREEVRPGTCARIMTGAPFPRGADAVVPVEWTGREGELVRIGRAPAPGQNRRAAGRDVRRGDLVIEAGTVVTPPVVGMMAALGCSEVAVRARPRVAVLSTGDELVGVAETPGHGQIRDANGPALAAQAVSAGAAVTALLRAPDDRERLRQAVEAARAADVLLVSGGVSVGAYDLVKDVLDEEGLDLVFWRVRQRPGKPLAFGLLAGRPVFGLPGNPVSSGVCFEQYVRPALAAMLGRRETVRARYPAVLAAPVAKPAGLHHFVRGFASFDASGRLSVRDTGAQDSNLYSSLLRADCLFHLPEAMEDPPAGTLVEMEWLVW